MTLYSIKKHIFFYIFLIFFLLIFSYAQGSMVQLSLEQLVHNADLIIVGTVEGVESKWVDGKIFSFAAVSVNSWIKGRVDAGCDRVIVRFPGGTIGDVSMHGSESPDYRHDDKAVIFLKAIPAQGLYETLGSSQGKFLIRENIVLKENIPLDQFVEDIEKTMNSEK